MNGCENCIRHKQTPRGGEEVKALVSRLNRISGQLGGIAKMLEENRYCGDILVQVAAAESALRAFGRQIFEEHFSTCVVEQIRSGEEGVTQETLELMRRLR